MQREDQAAPEPSCVPKEPVPPSPGLLLSGRDTGPYLDWEGTLAGEEKLDAMLSPSYRMPRDTETSCALRGQGEALRLSAGSHILVPSYLLWKNSGSPEEGLGTRWPTLPPPPKGRECPPPAPPAPSAAVLPTSLPFLFSLPESRPPRDLDLEVFCDSVEQLEPELVRLPVLSPVAAEPELCHLPPGIWDSSAQQVWAEQKEAAGRELTTRSSPESTGEKGESFLP